MSQSSLVNRVYKISWVVVFAWVIGICAVNQAAAHAVLLRSDPAANDILETAPPAMRLWFSEAISPQFSQAQLLDARGQLLPTDVQTDPNDPYLLTVNFPELADGVYSVRWSILSEADGHTTTGLVVFGVGQGADLGTATAVVQETAVPWPDVLLRWLNFIFLAGIVGGFAVTYLVLNPAVQPAPTADIQRAAQGRILRFIWWCVLAAFVVGLVWVAWKTLLLTRNLPGSPPFLAVSWQWLSQTRLGLFWWLRQALLVVLAGYFWLLRRDTAVGVTAVMPTQTGLLLLVAPLLFALLLVQSLTSHAAALQQHTIAAIIADMLHLLGVCLWVGGLLALAVGLLPLVHRKSDFAALVRASWGPFGRMAVLSVGVIVATGLYSTGQQISSLDAMIMTLYGRTVLFKIGLMLAVGLVGASNAMLIHPRLAAPFAWFWRKPAGWTPLSIHKFSRLVVLEVALGLGVLLLAGLLTAAPTARDTAFTAAEDIPNTLSQTADDMIISLTANPNLAGQNVFTVRAASSRRPPPADVLRVILRFTYQDQDFGMSSVDVTEVEPGFYLIAGDQLNLAGRWQIDVVVRRKGLEDSVAHFMWVVPQTGPKQAMILSNRPWEPLLTFAAAVLLLVMVLVTAVILVLGRRKSI